jgi:uncharacterized protein DUF6585
VRATGPRVTICATLGQFLLTSAGIATDRKPMLPWAQVQSVNLIQGYVVVNQHGKRLAWGKAPARATPNLYAFVELTGHLIAGARRS